MTRSERKSAAPRLAAEKRTGMGSNALEQPRQFVRRKVMDKKIGHDNVPDTVMPLRQPVPHFGLDDARPPAQRTDSLERFCFDTALAVEQRDGDIGPARRAVARDIEHEGTVTSTEFQNTARGGVSGNAIQCA